MISSTQARAAASAAIKYGKGALHLTSRGSIEIHWIEEENLSEVKRVLASAGLTSRGACGGAVRGVSTSSSFISGNPVIERVSQRLHRYFTANPRYERIPKKFKISVETDISTGRHLIQDAALLYIGDSEGVPVFDVYAGGGLGKEPKEGILLESGVTEERLIPLIESVLNVYTSNSAQGKRVKHLISQIGEERFKELVANEAGYAESLPQISEISPSILKVTEKGRVTAEVFAGEITASAFLELAGLADRFSSSVLVVTTDQNIDFYIDEDSVYSDAVTELEKLGFTSSGEVFRICPGSHSCKMGLSATRDIAERIITAAGNSIAGRSIALSGCPNSCAQPQLAEIGIITSSLPQDEDGVRKPRFDLYRRYGSGFGKKIASSLDEAALIGTLSDNKYCKAQIYS